MAVQDWKYGIRPYLKAGFVLYFFP